MATVVLDDALVGRFRVVVGPEEDVDAFTAEAFRALLEQRERQSPQWQAARAEAQTILDGPRTPHAESMAEMRRKYGIPDLSHLSSEQIMEEAEAILDSLPPEKIAEAKRLGLL